jgi:hypothetical protein
MEPKTKLYLVWFADGAPGLLGVFSDKDDAISTAEAYVVSTRRRNDVWVSEWLLNRVQRSASGTCPIVWQRDAL